jgi:hypothetical protein
MPLYTNPVTYFTIINTGRNSSAQRYKIKYKIEKFLFRKIKKSLIIRIRYIPANTRKPVMNSTLGFKIRVYEIRITIKNKKSAEKRYEW